MSIEDELAARALAGGFRPLSVTLGGFAGPQEVRTSSKYHNTRTAYKGVMYDSIAEAKRAEVLDLLEASGNISWWIGQPKFRLGVPENVYVADFLVVGPDGVWVEDVKGVETAKFRRDRTLWLAYGPCPLWVIKGQEIEVIDPKGGRK